ncbi:MAG: hypothetical protein QW625_03080 [Candidatus Nanoarchaeia archaeon]
MVEDKSGGDESWEDCLKKYAPELKNLEESEASTNSNKILIDKVVSINTMYFRVFVSKESNEPSENYFERIELLRKNIGPIELKNKMGNSYLINNLLNNSNSNLEKPTDGCVAIYEISNMAFNEKYVKEAIIQAFNNAQSKVCTSQKSNLIEKLKQTILDHFD